MRIRVRQNKDQKAVCRCGRMFEKVAVIDDGNRLTYLSYWCAKCDEIGRKK